MTTATTDHRQMNPVDVEAAIVAASNEVADGVGHVSRLYDEYTTAKQRFDQAWASAYLSSTGPVEERKQRCISETSEEAEALRSAEVKWKYARTRLEAAENRMSAMQSILKSIVAAYGAAGTSAY